MKALVQCFSSQNDICIKVRFYIFNCTWFKTVSAFWLCLWRTLVQTTGPQVLAECMIDCPHHTQHSAHELWHCVELKGLNQLFLMLAYATFAQGLLQHASFHDKDIPLGIHKQIIFLPILISKYSRGCNKWSTRTPPVWCLDYDLFIFATLEQSQILNFKPFCVYLCNLASNNNKSCHLQPEFLKMFTSTRG